MTNASAQEIEGFNRLAYTFWDDDKGPMHLLHRINPIRLAFIEDHTALHDKQILDVGCGGGILSESMAKKGAFVTGLDLADEVLSVASLHALEAGLSIEYRLESVEDFAQKTSAKFDVITCMELLEHVPDPASIVSTIASLLKPGGFAFFSTINRTLKAYAFSILAAEYCLKLLPIGTHRYAQCIQPAELLREIRLARLKPLSLQGLHYNPFTEQCSTSSNIDNQYLLACQADAVLC